MTRIIIAASPIYGHVAPLCSVAAALVRKGYPVTFLTGSRFPFVQDTGARFVPLTGIADYDASQVHRIPERNALPGGPPQLDYDFRHLFFDPIPIQHRALQSLLAEAEAIAPDDPVVVLHDVAFLGTWPVLHGAAGIRPAGIVGLGIAPLTLTSVDTAPFGLGLEPDNSEAGRQRNRALNAKIVDEVFAGTQAHLRDVLRTVGAEEAAPFFFDGMVSVPDRYLQLSIEGLEYQRSDAPAGLRYIGALPPAAAAGPSALPAGWADKLGGKPVIVVTQGTVANHDLEELIAPTLRALARLDVTVIALTGSTSDRLKAVPANAHVAEFVPFSELLPRADILISNGGYGGVQQALAHGVPLILAGATEDKIEVNARAAHTGAAINLYIARPTELQLRMAVQTMLESADYRANARRLQREYARHDSLSAIVRTIEEFASEAVPVAAAVD